MAGESARESARRQREKAERLRRSAELWERGAEGEALTAETLAQLPADTWTVFHDLRWPGRRFANIDHVVVGPPGVFVIDTKNWSGAITVKDDVLRCNGYKKEREVAAAADSALAIAGLVPLLTADLVKPVLCFVRDEPLTGWTRDVMVTSTGSLVPMLLSRPAVLSAEDIRALTLDLDAGIRSATLPTEPVPPAVAPAAGTKRSSAPAPRSRATAGATRRKKSSGRIPSLVALLAVIIFLGSPELRAGVVDGMVGLLMPEVADTSTNNGEPPTKKQCKKDPDREGCASQ